MERKNTYGEHNYGSLDKVVNATGELIDAVNELTEDLIKLHEEVINLNRALESADKMFLLHSFCISDILSVIGPNRRVDNLVEDCLRQIRLEQEIYEKLRYGDGFIDDSLNE